MTSNPMNKIIRTTVGEVEIDIETSQCDETTNIAIVMSVGSENDSYVFRICSGSARDACKLPWLHLCPAFDNIRGADIHASISRDYGGYNLSLMFLFAILPSARMLDYFGTRLIKFTIPTTE